MPKKSRPDRLQDHVQLFPSSSTHKIEERCCNNERTGLHRTNRYGRTSYKTSRGKRRRESYNKLETSNGCILADSVGRSKPFTGPGGHQVLRLRNKSVLFLAPKKLAEKRDELQTPT